MSAWISASGIPRQNSAGHPRNRFSLGQFCQFTVAVAVPQAGEVKT
jgi:hypothetical protein